MRPHALGSPAVVVIAAGVCAALHVGKLAPALPVLRDALRVSLVQAGFLLSLVQLAGMLLGLLVGLWADGAGLRRSLLIGLLLLALASAGGVLAYSAIALLVLRAVEGLGFLLVALPAPGLIRRAVAPQRMSAVLGWWGAYMPLGTALALLTGPWVIASTNWQAWWWWLAALSLVMALWVWVCVPLDPPVTTAQGYAGARPWADGARLPPAPSILHKASTAPSQTGLARLRQTLSARGPWLVALIFAMYSSQWLAVIGFLPTTVARAGLAAGVSAVLTASVAAVNILGNVLAGRLLQRGVPAQRLLLAGFGAMGLGALLAFGTWQGQPLPLAA